MRLASWLLALAHAAPVLAQPNTRPAARLPSFRTTILLDTLAVMNRSEHEAPPAVVWPLLAESVKSIDPELATAGGSLRGGSAPRTSSRPGASASSRSPAGSSAASG